MWSNKGIISRKDSSSTLLILFPSLFFFFVLFCVPKFLPFLFSLLSFFLDELQYITITGCDTTSSNKKVVFLMVDSTYHLQNVTFNCDASAAVVKSEIFSSTSLNVHVNQISSTVNSLLTSQVCSSVIIIIYSIVVCHYYIYYYYYYYYYCIFLVINYEFKCCNSQNWYHTIDLYLFLFVYLFIYLFIYTYLFIHIYLSYFFT